MGSRKVRIILSVPVHLKGSNQAAKAHVHKVSDVSEETTAAREWSNNQFLFHKETEKAFFPRRDQFFKIRKTQWTPIQKNYNAIDTNKD